MQAISQGPIAGVFYVGEGEPLDNTSPAVNSYTESNQGALADASACKSACAGIPNIKSFSFFEDGGEPSNDVCRCWYGGASDIVSTDGNLGSIGYTYCFGCLSEEPSLIHPLPKRQLELDAVLPSSQPSSQPSGQPSSQPSEMPSGQPSSQPSGQPSTSGQPKSQPSEMPSGQPTSQPSMNPSVSHWPTTLPSESPSTSTRPSISAVPSSQVSTQNTLLRSLIFSKQYYLSN